MDLFIQVKKEVAKLRCKKKGPYQAQHPLIDDLTAHKVEPSGTKSAGFKVMATFIFPFKAFGNDYQDTLHTFMAASLQTNTSTLKKKPQAFVMREDMLCNLLTQIVLVDTKSLKYL